MRYFAVLISMFLCALFAQTASVDVCASELVSSNVGAAKTIVNPVTERGADPWVVRHGGYYCYCYVSGSKIVVNRHKTLTGALQRPVGSDWQKQLEEKQMGRIVWAPEPGKPYSKEVWAPELHRIGNRWYIYFAADDGHNENHRMYVLRSKADDPMGEYALVGKIAPRTDKWAIDGTVMEHKGKLYFMWSGWEGDINVAQNLYIARMKSPTQIDGERVMISAPTYGWERVGEPYVNEGPEILQHNGRTFVIYSASGSWTDSYCLGQLTLVGDDPMDAKAWRKEPKPVFAATKDVKGPGHASFVKSPDGKEDWIVYHAARYPGGGWNRNVRIQPFTWDDKGNPRFGEPVNVGVKIKAPSGE